MIQILRLSLPMTLWLIGFSTLYALEGLSCSRHWPPGLEPRAVLITAAALLVGLQGLAFWLTLLQPPRSNPAPNPATNPVDRIAAGLAAAALGAAVWTSAPVLALAACG